MDSISWMWSNPIWFGRFVAMCQIRDYICVLGNNRTLRSAVWMCRFCGFYGFQVNFTWGQRRVRLTSAELDHVCWDHLVMLLWNKVTTAGTQMDMNHDSDSLMWRTQESSESHASENRADGKCGLIWRKSEFFNTFFVTVFSVFHISYVSHISMRHPFGLLNESLLADGSHVTTFGLTLERSSVRKTLCSNEKWSK